MKKTVKMAVGKSLQESLRVELNAGVVLSSVVQGFYMVRLVTFDHLHGYNNSIYAADVFNV